jgi:hypothetical protein
MNLNLPDLSVVSRLFGGLVNELRQKRLWPVVALLVVALAAVPVLLKKSSHPAPVAQTPIATPPPNPASTLPALNVRSSPAHSRLSGSAHNPFGNPASSPTTSSTTSVTSSAASTASTAAGTAASTLSGGVGASSGAGPTGGSSTPSTAASGPITTSGTTGPNPPSITPNAHPKPAPSGLRATQSYDVSMAITSGNGGVNTVDPLTRLSLIPSDQQPLLVELGVEQGGKHILFAVQPGAVVNGPGSCTPGPLDCEILSLGQDQTEQLSARTGAIGSSQVALFAITGITATNHSSARAADKARRAESAAGRAVLNKDALPSLSLFQYDPSVGSVVDERNLTVGVANAS